MMATYFNAGASEIHSDNLQTLYLMNPIYSGTPLASSEIQGFHYNLTGEFRRPQGLSLSLNDSPAKKVMSPASETGASTGGGKQSGILGSKYMRAAQQLLDEAVNVGKEMKMADSGREKAKEVLVSDDDGLKKEGLVVAELSTAQRQELQMKKAKLLNMLDEVEQRYREYHGRMQAVVSSLEQAAGLGSAKSYTALALHTISKQFRCLKDAISSQIKETGRSLGEEEEGKRESRSRLRLVDQQMRQQRAALQQLGVMHQHHHNAWRPQRGLPEKAVSVLRAWLFEHFLHPYPKDSDKHMLAKQTGLTRSQVSNWFINARVRLWKPMVEEMYLEETKGVKQQNDTKDHNDNNDNPNNDSTHTSKSTPTHLQSPRIPQNPNPINDIPNSTIISPPPALRSFSTGMESSKRQRSNTFIVDIQNNSPNIILSMDRQIEMKEIINSHHGGFGPNYNPVGEIGSSFNPDYHHHHQLGQSHYNHSGNAVLLTLGLPHCENLLSSFSSDHQQNFMPEFVGGGGGGGYEGDDIQNRKRYAGQVMSDFVA